MKENHYSGQRKIFNLLMRLVMNSYTLYKLNTQKAINRQHYLIQIIESLASEYKKYYIWKTKQSTTNSEIKTLPRREEKDCFVCSNRKKNKLGANLHKRFALNVTKAYMVLAWASINVNKYIILCYLGIFLLC